MADITTAELIAEYERLAAHVAERKADGMSTEEIKDATGWSEVKTRRFIMLGLRVGSIIRGRKYKHCIDGVSRPVSSFSFVKRQSKKCSRKATK